MNDPLSQFYRLRLGHRATVRRIFSAEDLRCWCDMAGIETSLQAVPEPLIAGLFSYLLGEKLPGHGTNYLKQHMRFENSAMSGENLTATVTITRLRPEKALVDLDTICTGDDGHMVCSGGALVLFRR